MPQFLNLSTIKKWIKDYRANKQLPNETNSVTIDLEKLELFLKEIKNINAAEQRSNSNPKLINAVRFYFTRQNNISDSNVANDANHTINDNIGTASAGTVAQRRMTLFYDKNFEPQTQISLLALPVKNYTLAPMPDNAATRRLAQFRDVPPNTPLFWWTGKDYTPNEDRVLCLYARNWLSEHTGMCPYNCADTLGD